MTPSDTLINTYLHALLSTGHDIKSLMLNLLATLIFLLPIAIYLKRELTQTYITGVGILLLVTTIVPPFGLYRPHPYSDWPRNKPFKFRGD